MLTPKFSSLPTLFSLLAADNDAYFRTFTTASVAGIYSLFPLLFTPAGESHFGSGSLLLMNVSQKPQLNGYILSPGYSW